MKFIIPWNEVEVTATRSSGAGGQHVNKTNSAVQIRFSVSASLVLTDIQKEKVLRRLAHRLVQGDEILVRSEEERDQKRNKEKAFENLNKLIATALIDPKKRIATKPKRSSVQKRLTSKKTRGEIKKIRSEKIKW
jgi:ribosome-associated protein